MIENLYKKEKFKRILKSSVFSGLISVVVESIIGIKYWNISASLSKIIIGLVSPFLIGFFISLSVFTLLDWIDRNHKTSKQKYFIKQIMKMLVFIVCVFIVYFIFAFIFFPTYAFSSMSIIFTLVLSIILATILMVSHSYVEFLGKTFFINLFTGKYHVAKKHVQTFLFIDIKNSTSFAEKLTEKEFFDLLNEFFFIVEVITEINKGDIYKFVGDGAIIVWEDSKKLSILLQTFLSQVTSELKEKEKYFEKKYGKKIEVTIGVHRGDILIGELGVLRKEIGYWGDTINTAQRIQSSCKNYNTDIMISNEIMELFNSSINETKKSFHYEKIENVELRGKLKKMDLVSVKIT